MENPMGLNVVYDSQDHNGDHTRRQFLMYFKLPPMVGDQIVLPNETVVVTARQWVPNGEIQIFVERLHSL